MIIFVLGNICSGKTTICKELQRITGFQYTGIDQLRRQYNPGATMPGEILSWFKAKEILSSSTNIIFETSGTSKRFNDLFHSIEALKIKVLLTSPIEILKERLTQRMSTGYNFAPIPYDLNPYQSQEHIQKMARYIKADLIFNTSELTYKLIVDHIRTKIN